MSLIRENFTLTERVAKGNSIPTVEIYVIILVCITNHEREVIRKQDG